MQKKQIKANVKTAKFQERTNRNANRVQGRGVNVQTRQLEKTNRALANVQKMNEAAEPMEQLFQANPSRVVAETVKNRFDRDGGQLREQVRGYLGSNGYAPDEIAEDDYILAAQFHDLYDTNIQDISEGEAVPYDRAEIFYHADDENVSNLDPMTTAFLKAAGKKAYTEIAKQRAQQGKQTLGQQYDPKTGKLISSTPKPGTVADIYGKSIDAGADAAKRDQYAAEMPKLIAVGLGILFLGIVVAITFK